MTATEFTGLTKDPTRRLTPRGTPYELRTDEGAHVHPHNTDFQHLTYTPGRPPTLELEFRYRSD